ncbi:MAG: hypothetical protein GY679_00095 [Mycoplasma sp.]|nr:hypothetical protein [Mycoplasma sp.]
MSEINECPNSTVYQPTGDSGCPQDLTVARKIFLYKAGVNYATIDLAKEEASLDTLIQNEDVIPFKLVEQADNSDKEEEMWEGNAGGTHKIADAVTKNTFNLITTPSQHAFLRSYDQFSGGYVIVDRNENVRMYTEDGTTVDPITIGVMSVGIHTTANDGTPSFTPITISDAFPREWNNSPVSFKPSYKILAKNGLLPVRLKEVGSSTSTSIVVNVTNYDTGAAVAGLTEITDWILADSQTITGAAESATIPGQYTISGTGLVSGTLNLANPEDLGVTGYKSVGAITITIS